MKLVNDKYYTPISVANHCWDVVSEVIGENNVSEIIEPSVGNGSFLHHNRMTPHFAYDIDPNCVDNHYTKIITADYLSQNINYLPGRLVVGNPPYGSRMNMAQKFFKKSIAIADYIGFVLPISQLNNTMSMFEFDLIYSEDLGIETYTDRDLHCCFNIYKRPETGVLNSKPSSKLRDITIYRQDSRDYATKNYDVRMCYWGDGTCGKILKDGESYSAEYKIKINSKELYPEIYNVITTYNWKNYVNCIAMKKLQQFHIIDVLRKNIPNIK